VETLQYGVLKIQCLVRQAPAWLCFGPPVSSLAVFGPVSSLAVFGPPGSSLTVFGPRSSSLAVFGPPGSSLALRFVAYGLPTTAICPPEPTRTHPNPET